MQWWRQESLHIIVLFPIALTDRTVGPKPSLLQSTIFFLVEKIVGGEGYVVGNGVATCVVGVAYDRHGRLLAAGFYWFTIIFIILVWFEIEIK